MNVFGFKGCNRAVFNVDVISKKRGNIKISTALECRHFVLGLGKDMFNCIKVLITFVSFFTIFYPMIFDSSKTGT